MDHPGSSHSFRYVHTDIPPGMTISEWRHQRASQRKPSRPSVTTRVARRKQQLVAAIVRAVVGTGRRAGGAWSGLAAKHGTR